MPEAPDYWLGYRAALQDLRLTLAGGKDAGWTMTSDVRGLIGLIDARLDGIDPPDENDDIPFSETERFRAYDPHGGNGKDGRFEVATSYGAIAVDKRAMLIKAGLPDDSFDPDDAEAFGRHLIRCATRARLASEPASSKKTCSTCEGEGVVRNEAQHGGVPAQEAPCPDCDGTPAEPDMFEGDPVTRIELCDHAGHDLEGLPMGMPGKFCVQCGAEWSVPASGDHEATEE